MKSEKKLGFWRERTFGLTPVRNAARAASRGYRALNLSEYLKNPSSWHEPHAAETIQT